MALRENEKVVWSGEHRAPLTGQGVYPRPVQNPIPLWIAVGGTPESVVRAGMLGLPLAIAIIGGMPEQFAPLVDLYRRAVKEGGHDPAKLPVSINSHGYVADTTEKARADAFPPLADAMTRIGRERGWPPTTKESLVAGTEPQGRAVHRQSGRGDREDPLSVRVSSVTTASSSSSASARCRMTGCCTPSSCSGQKSRRWCGRRLQARQGQGCCRRLTRPAAMCCRSPHTAFQTFFAAPLPCCSAPNSRRMRFSLTAPRVLACPSPSES